MPDLRAAVGAACAALVNDPRASMLVAPARALIEPQLGRPLSADLLDEMTDDQLVQAADVFQAVSDAWTGATA